MITNDTRKEIIKACAYGHSAESIAAAINEDVSETSAIIVSSRDEIEKFKAYISSQKPKFATTAASVGVGAKAHYGIDISVWNGRVDMGKVKASGKDFVFIRSGYGNTSLYPSQIDSRFAENVKNAKAAGIAWGVYHYMYATSVSAAKAEAEAFVKQLDKIKPIPHLCLLDIEESSQTSLSAEAGQSLIKAFADVVQAAGYWLAIYTFDSYAQKLGSPFCSKYTSWIANINRVPTAPHDGWQYSWVGRVDGCIGDVDLDSTETDFPAKIKAAGKNGYKKPEIKKALDTTGFKRGDKGLGVYYLKRYLMKHLGYKMNDDKGFGAGTEKAVNDLLSKNGYRANGIAGENFAKLFIK